MHMFCEVIICKFAAARGPELVSAVSNLCLED